MLSVAATANSGQTLTRCSYERQMARFGHDCADVSTKIERMRPWDSSLRPSGEHASLPVAAGPSVTERYEVRELLGRGGMASVYRADERASGRTLALKRLEPSESAQRRQRIAALFEREYRALLQLAHPRVVEVYDYGVDADGPWYTLELLDGGDLHEVAPVAWQAACAIARDVCSALSLLHSRRLVHRDVSPRNVRRTQDGTAKLIDFGAIAPMGPNKLLVGTPPCCAPESLQLQALDARTDLFALGATLYFALTGRHAFAARSFADLASVWQHGLALPSQLVPEVPAALDALVADLLQLEPDARPSNASEVIERLCAIDGQAHVEHLQVAHAYLSSPPLIGRGAQLQQLQNALRKGLQRERSATGGFSVCLIEGESGVGRSRILDACLLDAALRGAICVRADAEDAAHGDYGVLRGLARQLHVLLPEASHVSSQELDLGPLSAQQTLDANVQDSRALRPRLQAAVCSWLSGLAAKRPIVLAVDDCERADEPSAAALAMIAYQLPRGVCIVLSAESGATWTASAAKQVLLEEAERVTLHSLSAEQSEQLLAAVFNDAPNVSSLALRLHALSHGKPRDLMRLALHLTERGSVRYEAGAWTLPARVDEMDLPSSMAQALYAGVASLSSPARELAAALALCSDSGFSHSECAVLLDLHDRGARDRILEQLTAAEIVHLSGDHYRLAHPLWQPPLRAQLSAEQQQRLERRLARLFTLRQQQLRAAQYLLRAGELSSGLDALVDHSRVSQDATAASAEEFLRYARSLPADWLETFEHALRLCEVLRRPPSDRYCLLGRMSGIMPAFGIPGRAHFAALIQMLELASGYSDYRGLDAAMPDEQRAEQALALAQLRYENASEDRRVLPPLAALRMLLRTLMSAASSVALSVDMQFLRSFPDLSGFARHVPGVGILSSLFAGMVARYSGRLELGREIYIELIERTATEHGGLDPSHLDIMRLAVMNGLAVTEACMGMASSASWSDRTAVHQAYRMNSLHSRMLYYLYSGDLEQVESTVRQIERLRVQTLQLYETSTLLWEIGAHVVCEDLTRLRRALEALGKLAEGYPAWRAVQHYVSAEYQRLLRDPLRALPDNEAALALAQVAEHPLWAAMASAHVRVLCALERHADALKLCESYLQQAREAQLGLMAEELWIAYALCQAQLGQRDAIITADGVIERLKELGVRGIWLGLAHEARASIALTLHDQSFELHLQNATQAYGTKHPALRAKLRRLSQEAERRDGEYAVRSSLQAEAGVLSDTGLRLLASLDACVDSTARAQLTLSVVRRQLSARAGMVYLLRGDQLQLAAATSGERLPDDLRASVQRYIEAQARAPERTLTGDDTRELDPLWPLELSEYRPLLLSHATSRGLLLTGVVVLIGSAPTTGYPGRLLAALSRFWADTGEVSTLLAIDESPESSRAHDKPA